MGLDMNECTQKDSHKDSLGHKILNHLCTIAEVGSGAVAKVH